MEKGLLLEIDGLYGNYKGGLLTKELIELLKKGNKDLFKSFNIHCKDDVFDIDKFILLKDINLDENGDLAIQLSEINDLFNESGFVKINYYKTNEVFYNIEKKETLIEQRLKETKSFEKNYIFELNDFKYIDQKAIYNKDIIIASHSFYNNVKKRYLIKNLSNIKDFDPDRVFMFIENLFLEQYHFFDIGGKELIKNHNRTLLKEFYYIHDMEMIDFLIKIIKEIEPEKTLEQIYYSSHTKTNYGVNGYEFNPKNIREISELFDNLIYSKTISVKDKEVFVNKKFLNKIKSYFEPYKLYLIEDFDFNESILLEKTISVKNEDSSFKLLNDKYIFKNKKR